VPKIPLSKLLDTYIDRIDEDYEQDGEDNRRVPSLKIIQQFTQLITLGRAGLLDIDIPEMDLEGNQPYTLNTSDNDQQNETPDSITNEDTTEPMSDNNTSAQERAKAETEAFEKMINEQPALKDSPSRRAAFTLGSLITTVSGHQKSIETKPLNSRLKPTTISKHNFEEYVTEVLDLINTYAASNNQVWKYQTQTSQLTEDLTEISPDEWDLSSSDIQYHIALGMAFGAESHA
jgi:CRISPR-associated protein Cas8b/Csh1 subtype I-B